MKRRWLFWLLIIAFAWLLYARRTEVTHLAGTLAEGQWQWVLVAALLQVGFYVAFAGLYWSSFDIVGVKSRLWDLLPVTFAATFVNVAAPSGGASGIALFVDDARRRGQSPNRAAIGTFLAVLADFGGFLFVLAFALVYLFTHRDLQSYELGGAGILVALVGGVAGLLLVGLWRPAWLPRLLTWAQRTANAAAARLRRSPFVAEDWAERTAAEFIEASIAVAANPAGLFRTLLISFLSYILDLASLYCLFLAFHQAVSLGVLIAGFSMGILFTIVSFTPMGVGVVEVLVTAVLASLGVPTDRAAVISLSFRGLTFWIPLGTGFLLLRRVKAFGAEEVTRSEAWGVRVVAVLAAVMGFVNILSAVRPAMHHRLALLEQYSPFGVSTGGHLTSALAGFALLVLSIGLWRRKRVAWTLALAILILSIPVHLIKGLDYEEAILAGLLAIWLAYLRPHFHARSDPPSVRQGLAVLLAALMFTLIYGTVGFYALDRHFRQHFGFGAAVRQTLVMFTAYYNPGLQPITGFGRYFGDSIYVVAAVTTGYALAMIIRPVLIRQPHSPGEEERAAAIVRNFGRTVLARLALMDDKQYFFSAGGAVVAYALEGRVAIALGDPIAPSQDVPATITAFKAFCQLNDWLTAFHQVLPDFLPAYRAAGFDSLCIGQAGIVDLASFTLSGRSNKSLRSSVNRVSRLGYTVEVAEPPHSPPLLQELRAISDEWLTNMRGAEKRFSLGWFDEKYLNDCPLILVRDPQGLIAAFANVVILPRANQISVDMMRHRSLAESGLMDFLFSSLCEYARGAGYSTFDLGLSSLAGIGQSPDDPGLERALHYIYEHVDQFYNYQGLHAFKDKFNPEWSPRYLIYPGFANLPAVTVALIRADAGGDILAGYLRHPK
jgi:phosphatidylglycerol lysyltransferase